MKQQVAQAGVNSGGDRIRRGREQRLEHAVDGAGHVVVDEIQRGQKLGEPRQGEREPAPPLDLASQMRVHPGHLAQERRADRVGAEPGAQRGIAQPARAVRQHLIDLQDTQIHGPSPE